jgi:hypothetical protein
MLDEAEPVALPTGGHQLLDRRLLAGETVQEMAQVIGEANVRGAPTRRATETGGRSGWWGCD